MKATLLILLLGCAPTAIAVGPDHPANPEAPTGRLAGPPPALRAGVADVSIPERGVQEPPRKETQPPASKQMPGKDKPKQQPAHQGHEGHH